MQPRKSKALIITFIIVLVLLIVGYFIVVRGGILKGNSTILGKKFDPILGTSKPKDIIVGKDGTENPDANTNPDTNTKPDTEPKDGGTNGGGGGTTTPTTPVYIPPNLSFPPLKTRPYEQSETDITTECSDGLDNDKDGSRDSEDNDCHSDGDAKNPNSFNPIDDSEDGTKNKPTPVGPTPDPEKKKISCDTEEIPLVFTEEEQKQLDELTREFYRLSPKLKTENDIVAEVSTYYGYKDLIRNTEDLIAQCRAQTSTPEYLQNNFLEEKLSPLTPNDGVIFADGHDCKTDPTLCHDAGRTLSIGFVPDDGGETSGAKPNAWCFTEPQYCHEVKWTYKGLPGDTLVSLVHKGRVERIRNPYYDSSKEKYPFKETPTYIMQYFTSPVSTARTEYPFYEAPPNNKTAKMRFNPNPPKTKDEVIWIYADKEKSWGVW